MKYKDHGLVVLGFNSSDDHDKGVEFLKENKVTFPSILDNSRPADEAIEKYETMSGRSAVPMSCILDKKGNIVEAWYGYKEGYAEEVLRGLGF
jgi:peroxiredoxin